MGQVDPESVQGNPEKEALRGFGRRIARLRRARGWSRGELAARLGISRERLGNWERGANTPPLERLIALGAVLSVSIDELLTGEPAPGDRLTVEEKQEVARHLEALERLLESWDEKTSTGRTTPKEKP